MSVTVNLTTATKGAGSTASTRAFARASSPPAAAPFNSEAVTLSLSPGQLAKKHSSARALRSLSDASSFVSIAKGATDEIDRLISKSKTIAQTIEKTVDPTRKAALAEEAAAAVTEIDRVVSQATTTGSRSVVNFGAQSYSFTLDGGDRTSQKNDSVFISNVATSRSDLGLDGITSDDFAADPSSAISTLDEAKSRVGLAQTNLSNTEREIATVAEKFGIRAKDTTVTVSNASAEVDTLAQKISELVSATTAKVSSKLDAERVKELVNGAASTPPVTPTKDSQS